MNETFIDPVYHRDGFYLLVTGKDEYKCWHEFCGKAWLANRYDFTSRLEKLNRVYIPRTQLDSIGQMLKLTWLPKSLSHQLNEIYWHSKQYYLFIDQYRQMKLRVARLLGHQMEDLWTTK